MCPTVGRSDRDRGCGFVSENNEDKSSIYHPKRPLETIDLFTSIRFFSALLFVAILYLVFIEIELTCLMVLDNCALFFYCLSAPPFLCVKMLRFLRRNVCTFSACKSVSLANSEENLLQHPTGRPFDLLKTGILNVLTRFIKCSSIHTSSVHRKNISSKSQSIYSFNLVLSVFIFLSNNAPGLCLSDREQYPATTVSCLKDACQVTSYEVNPSSWNCGFSQVEGDFLGGRFDRRQISYDNGRKYTRKKRRTLENKNFDETAKEFSVHFKTKRSSENREFAEGDFDRQYTFDDDHIGHRSKSGAPSNSRSGFDYNSRRNLDEHLTSEYGQRKYMLPEAVRTKLDPDGYTRGSSETRLPDHRRQEGGSGRTNPRYQIPESQSAGIPKTYNGRGGQFYATRGGGKGQDVVRATEVVCRPRSVKLARVDQLCRQDLGGVALLVGKL